MSGHVFDVEQDSTWFTGVFIGLALSTLASTAALFGASLALSTAALSGCNRTPVRRNGS